MNNLTLSEDNQFSFVCPIFNAETKMSTCMKLREWKWMGKTIEKRRGCQAAMSCGKCPAAETVSQIIYRKSSDGVPDNYGSKTPVVGKLRADLLDRILAPMFREDILRYYSVPDEERVMMEGANDRIRAQLKTAPKGEGNYSARHVSSDPVTTRKRSIVSSAEDVTEKKQTPVSKSQTPVSKSKKDAAMTGDLSAALNG